MKEFRHWLLVCLGVPGLKNILVRLKTGKTPAEWKRIKDDANKEAIAKILPCLTHLFDQLGLLKKTLDQISLLVNGVDTKITMDHINEIDKMIGKYHKNMEIVRKSYDVIMKELVAHEYDPIEDDLSFMNIIQAGAEFSNILLYKMDLLRLKRIDQEAHPKVNEGNQDVA